MKQSYWLLFKGRLPLPDRSRCPWQAYRTQPNMNSGHLVLFGLAAEFRLGPPPRVLWVVGAHFGDHRLVHLAQDIDLQFRGNGGVVRMEGS